MVKQRMTLFDFINIAVLIIVLIVCLYPFYYVLIYSISDPIEAASGVYLYPKGFNLSAYTEVFRLENLVSSIGISVYRAVVGTLLTVFCCSCFAYLLSKREMWFRKFIYRLVVATMYLNAGLIATYLTYSSLGLRNNLLVYVLPAAISAFYVVLIKTFIEQLPASLEEAAMIDGAGYVRSFFQIILPLSLPVLATVSIFSAVNQWNSWIDSLLFMSNGKLFAAQHVLYNFINQASAIAAQLRATGRVETGSYIITPKTLIMTVTMVVTLPILLVYPFFQRFFAKGMLLGAVKG
jgi:putative aldouronate transport system permease protein